MMRLAGGRQWRASSVEMSSEWRVEMGLLAGAPRLTDWADDCRQRGGCGPAVFAREAFAKSFLKEGTGIGAGKL